MDKSTHDSAKKVNIHREDGEEAIKRSAKVVPIDRGKGSESAENANTPPPASKKSRKEDK